jgi:flagellar basal-body rod modification protein FlgD
MDITRVSTSQAAGGSIAGMAGGSGSAPTGTATLDYNAFLQLLIAQLQNQDPMEPMRSSDYVAQLATFSQVEKTIETNERVAALLSAVQLQQAEGIIGRTATSADGHISGLVSASRVVDGEVLAILSDGREITIGPGVTLGGRGD